MSPFFQKPGELYHIGVKRRSGRYPWGSGNDPQQRSGNFLSYVDKLHSEGLSEVDIAEGLGMTTTQLRNKKSVLKSEKRAADSALAFRLKDKGMTNVAIGKRMGLNESSVRSLLNPSLQIRSNVTAETAKMLKRNVEQKGYIDVGAGVESGIGISRTKLNTAISMLEDEGYQVMYVKTQQLGTGKYTSIKVLAPPGTEYKELYKNRANIATITDGTKDGGLSYTPPPPIVSVNSKRISVRYKGEGGDDKDGVIELRRNVDDLSLGNSKYAQVRIAVDGTHYLKGMAMYSDNMPNGIDIIYNVSKPKGDNKLDVFKKMKADKDGNIDPENPFGSVIKANGRQGALNIVNEEGDWGKWSKSISSQVLSKQAPSLAKKQLGELLDRKKSEFDEINSLTNPGVKRALLLSFSDDADSSAVHLKAAALPRQASHVILPITSLKPDEIYAPSYKDGEKVVLIRHPHGGIFEIPELSVNNKNPEANRLIRNAKDAVGIHPSVASKLSGADFDGDTVLVIPNKDRNIHTAPSIKSLKDFSPKEAYPAYEGMPKMSPRTKQLKMGDVSNLITDMTIKGASQDEIARAVRHSMVVIDAEKHNLNYKQSAIDNGISALKKKYQGSERAGAATLISRASSEIRVGERKDRVIIDQKTGAKIYIPTNGTYKGVKTTIDPVTGKKIYTETGKTFQKLSSSTKMDEAKDAYTLSSGTRIESVYAEHANALKALGNKARKTMIDTASTEYSPSARLMYSKEVERLKAALVVAYANKPLERKAQLLADKIFRAKKEANPNMDAADLKKIKGMALEEARARAGAKKHLIEISDKEWEAIQMGAISTNSLSQILLNTDLDKLKARALPRSKTTLTNVNLSRARIMLSNGRTTEEVASALGISTSTLQNALK